MHRANTRSYKKIKFIGVTFSMLSVWVVFDVMVVCRSESKAVRR